MTQQQRNEMKAQGRIVRAFFNGSTNNTYAILALRREAGMTNAQAVNLVYDMIAEKESPGTGV